MSPLLYFCTRLLELSMSALLGLTDLLDFAQAERRLFTTFGRQVFCSLDKWHGMTMEDIRKMEDETKTELEQVGLVVHDGLWFRVVFR